MATRLLHLVCTPRGLASNTGRVSNALLEALHEVDDDLDVRTIDLFTHDLPAVAGSNIKAKYALMTGQALDADARSSWRAIEQTIEEFLAADAYLLTVPMWNFGIPYALKYYIDAIVQPGYLFRYDESGRPHGLVHGRKMIVVTSRGADYSSEPMQRLDFVEGYLRTVFGFVGITDVTFFTVQPMDISRDLRSAASRESVQQARQWVRDGGWGAPAVDDDLLLPPEANPRVLADNPGVLTQ